MRTITVRRRLLALIVVPLLVFASAELVIRILRMELRQPYGRVLAERGDQTLYRWDPLLFWAFRPAARPWINSKGYPGREVEVARSPGVIRIIAFGDSCTRGPWVDAFSETYPAVLERELNAGGSGRRYEVANMGCDGYSSFQMLTLMRREVPRYRPDLVIVNPDTHGATPALEGLPDHECPNFAGLIFRTQEILGESKLYLLLRRVILRLRARPAARAYGGRTARVPLPLLAANMARMRECCEEAGAAIIFMNAQRYRIAETHSALVEHNRLVEAFCAENGLLFVDLYRLFKEHPFEESLYFDLPNDPCHPSAEGYRLIAAALRPLVERIVEERTRGGAPVGVQVSAPGPMPRE
ncbi:MAG: SGNH/GDSL hydrolase family protein [bacterium]|nr:SGNH/GDSL hydrolase family protein [bacterium]